MLERPGGRKLLGASDGSQEAAPEGRQGGECTLPGHTCSDSPPAGSHLPTAHPAAQLTKGCMVIVIQSSECMRLLGDLTDLSHILSFPFVNKRKYHLKKKTFILRYDFAKLPRLYLGLTLGSSCLVLPEAVVMFHQGSVLYTFSAFC